MKTRSDLYGREASELLRIISMYPGLSELQLCSFFPGKDEVIRTLLSHLRKQGRVTQEPSGGYYPQGMPTPGADTELAKAVWVLLDFIGQVEFHSASDFPVQAVFFSDGELYEIISIPAGKETLISGILHREKPEGHGKRILILEDPKQVSLLDIPGVSGYCTVSKDGRVNYYRKQ